MKRNTRELLIGLLVSVAFVGVLGLAFILWLTVSLFGTGCDPVLDPTQCSASELAAWKEAAITRPR